MVSVKKNIEVSRFNLGRSRLKTSTKKTKSWVVSVQKYEKARFAGLEVCRLSLAYDLVLPCAHCAEMLIFYFKHLIACWK